MTALCTYCCATKSRTSGEIPAIQRYRSCRIERVYQASCAIGLPFRILSGEYGLVSPERPIPDYDHLLRPAEVPALAQLVAQQIRAEGITGFLYFTKPLAASPNLGPYQDVLAAACQDTSTSLCVVLLGGEDMNSWRELMRAADKAKLAMISDLDAGKQEFSALLAQNPNDGMIYFKRGEAYEALGKRDPAKAAFQRAMALFPMAKWKAQAKEAIDRVS